MAETTVLTAQSREGNGSQSARKLRRTRLVPAVLYGHKEETLSLSVAVDELRSAIRRGARVVDLQTPLKLEKALIKELQWDHLGKELLHADFYRVSADERIAINVRLELRGTAPGVTAGGSLNQPLHTLNVECLAIAVPESIRVPIGELQIGSAVYVRDLHLPEGVKVLDDPDAIVVQVSAPVEEAEVAPAAAPVAETAEPEVIGRQKAPEEEEEAPK
jgi:large subunit ribosomal protein L25